MEVRKVQAFDNNVSLGITLPKTYTDLLGIKRGNFLKISLEGQKIIVEKV